MSEKFEPSTLVLHVFSGAEPGSDVSLRIVLQRSNHCSKRSQMKQIPGRAELFVQSKPLSFWRLGRLSARTIFIKQRHRDRLLFERPPYRREHGFGGSRLLSPLDLIQPASYERLSSEPSVLPSGTRGKEVLLPAPVLSQHNRKPVRRLAQWIIGQMRRSLPTIGKETPLETKWDANE